MADPAQQHPGIRPRPSLGRRLDHAARAAFPASSTALLLLLLAAPTGLVQQAALQSAGLLACVFFWSLYRPASLPPLAVFGLGLLADLLGNAPIGIDMMSMLLAQSVVLRVRRGLVRQSFAWVWFAFALLALAVALLSWALDALLVFAWLSPAPAVFEAALACGLYPALALLLTLAHRGLAAPEEA